MSAGDNSFELSSDEEDDILGTLRQQTAESRSSGGRSSTSYDPYGADTNSSSSAAFGRAPGTTSTSGDFGAMRDAFREAGLEDAAAPAPGASADDSLVVDFGAGLPPPGQSLEQADRDDGVVVASRDGLDGTAEVEFGTMRGDGAVPRAAAPSPGGESAGSGGPARSREGPGFGVPQPLASPASPEQPSGLPTDATSVYSPPGASEAASPLPAARFGGAAGPSPRDDVVASPACAKLSYGDMDPWLRESKAAESSPRGRASPSASAAAFAALAAAESDDDAPPSPPARRSAGRPDSGELPRPRDEAERLIAELQRDNERLSASLKAAYERAEAQERAAEEEKATLTARIREAETEAKLAAAAAKRPPSSPGGGGPDASRLRASLAVAAERDALAEELAAVRRAARDDAAELKARVAAAQQAADAAAARAAAPPAAALPGGDGRVEALEAQLAAAGERLAWFAENQRLVDEHVDVVRRQERELADLRRAVDGKVAPGDLRAKLADAERRAADAERALEAREPPPRLTKPRTSVEVAKVELEARCGALEKELDAQRDEHELRVRSLRQEFEKLRAAHDRKLLEVKADQLRRSRDVSASRETARSTDVAFGRGSGKSEDQAKARDLKEARDRVAYLEMALGDVTSRLGAAEKRLADGAGPASLRRSSPLRRSALTASVDSVPPPSAPPPPSPSRGDAPMTADALRIRSLEVELEREREINRVLGAARDAPEEKAEALEKDVAGLRADLDRAHAAAGAAEATRLDLEARLAAADAAAAPRVDPEAHAAETARLRKLLEGATRELAAARETARLAADDAARLERLDALRKPETPTKVAVAALAAQVEDLEARAKRRQDDVARCVHDAKVAARMELARAAARHAEELHAKDNQLQRFKFELDGLLDALKAEIANTAAGNTTKHDKTAQAYRAYAKETAE